MNQKQNMPQSLCIPRVENSITKDYIYKTLYNLRIGTIEKITEIPLRNEATHKRIIIKIKWDRNTKNSQAIHKFLTELGSFKLVYDMPWYWKVVTTHPQI